jgi:hypothetical protein
MVLKWNLMRILVCFVFAMISSDMLPDIVRSFAKTRNLAVERPYAMQQPRNIILITNSSQPKFDITIMFKIS